MELLDRVCQNTKKYIEKMPKEQRKKYGQFFTSKEVAVFMADLFVIPENKTKLTLLDPGTGSGILSAALIERLVKNGTQSINLVCYETDDNIMEILRNNLEYIKANSIIDFSYEIRNENYITSQKSEYNHYLGANDNPVKYDMVILNPPYKKIAKNAPEALAMPDVCYGTPNLYFLFVQMALFNLKDNSEMVAIIPRSWTSGAYFEHFRQKFLAECQIRHIHLFTSRDKVFENESILQETLIIKVVKSQEANESIEMTTSNSNKDFYNITTFTAPYNTVVSGKSRYVYLVTNKDEIEVITRLSKWNDTLPTLGLKMKTGLTVDFRNKEVLRNIEEQSTVPLFYSQHIQSGRVVFPIGRGNEYIVTNQSGLLQKNKNYLFVKRFTAKEEHRRLQCGVYLSKKFSDYSLISTQNKINFIDGITEISECVVFGLYVIFNSTFYDCYYRILNGSTQVNSTEVNSMPMPPMSIIEAMGKRLIAVKDMSENSCDTILRSYL